MGFPSTWEAARRAFIAMIVPGSILACLIFTIPCLAGAPEPGTRTSFSKHVRFSITVPKETYREMLATLPEVSISPDRGKIIAGLARRIGQTAPGIEEENRSAIAEEIYEKEILPLLAPRVRQFNSLMVSAATKDKVSAGFLAFKGLADGMAQGEDLSGIRVQGNCGFRKSVADGQPELEWDWTTSITGDSDSTRTLSAKIDETPVVKLEPYGHSGSFDFPISCEGKVALKKAYRENYHLSEKPYGSAEVSVSLVPEALLTASKSIESFAGFFAVEGELNSSVTKTAKYDATLTFGFDAAPNSD